MRRHGYGTIVLLIGVAGIPAATGATQGVTATGVDAPRFVAELDVIDHRYTGDFQFFVGGGVAAFDCDDDGLSELFFAGGDSPAALYRNDSEPGGPLRFARVASPVTDLLAVTGAYPLDVDSDGETDLVVLRVGEEVVLRGLGGCRFERANESLGLASAESWTVGFSATWEGANALPTLAFGDYLDASREACEDNRLVRPDETGEGYADPIPLAPGYCALSLLFSDWSRSGRRDLRLTNDRHYSRDGADQLWRVADGEAPVLYTEADGWRPLRIWGMGIASADVTGDGYPDVYLTSQGDNKLQTLADGPGQPTYEDIALELGVTAHRPFAGGDILPSTAWHAEFADVDNDGLLDLFIAKGNVEAQTEYATRDPSNLLLGQPDGSFLEGAEAAGIVEYHRARGAALVDLNVDGLLDLVVVNRTEPVSLWRNVGRGDEDDPVAMGNWIAVRVRQPAPNVDGIGGWLEVRTADATTVRELTVGGGHAGGQLGWLHVGLGDAGSAEVRVRWPDGEIGPWLTVDAGHFATLERGASAAIEWQPDEAL